MSVRPTCSIAAASLGALLYSVQGREYSCSALRKIQDPEFLDASSSALARRSLSLYFGKAAVRASLVCHAADACADACANAMIRHI
eukprot:12937-Heterococcus_DN1.PRE.1